MCAADSLTDHRLVVSKLSQPKNPTCTTTTIQESSNETGCFQVEKKTNKKKNKKNSTRQAFLDDIYNHLCAAVQLSSEDPEENWTFFRNAVHFSAVDTLGHTSRKHQDWFDENDEEIRGLLEENHRLHKMVLAQYPRRKPTITSVRQSGAD